VVEAVESIKVRIIPGCPSRVIAETEEDRVLAEETLANLDCGCVVELEAAAEELAEAAIEEAAAEVAEEAGKSPESVVYKGRVVPKIPTCSLEPDKPWEESVCGVVAEEAGQIAAEKVMARLREEGLIS